MEIDPPNARDPCECVVQRRIALWACCSRKEQHDALIRREGEGGKADDAPGEYEPNKATCAHQDV
jgi:hypothetical protein